MYINIIIIILSILCIAILANSLNKINTDTNEHFQNSSGIECNFVPMKEKTHPENLSLCVQYANENIDEKNACLNTDNEEGCVKKCENYHLLNNPCIKSDGATNCIISQHNDISGSTIQQCIDRCKYNTCFTGCTKYVIKNPDNGQIVEGTYTHRLADYDKCDASIENHKFCSKCVEECKQCSDPTRCTWLEPTENEDTERDNFRNTEFKIGVIPENKSAIIYWNEARSDVDSYMILYYRKDEVNLNDENVQQTPLQIRTIKRKFHQTGPNTHTINNLENGVAYTITINKISNHKNAELGPEVKASNTVDIVPSTVSVINFSRLNTPENNTLEPSSSKVMNNLLGTTLDISI
jgi:hypothetical protein